MTPRRPLTSARSPPRRACDACTSTDAPPPTFHPWQYYPSRTWPSTSLPRPASSRSQAIRTSPRSPSAPRPDSPPSAAHPPCAALSRPVPSPPVGLGAAGRSPRPALPRPLRPPVDSPDRRRPPACPPCRRSPGRSLAPPLTAGRVLAGANCHDSPLLAPTLDRLDGLGRLPDDFTVHLDAGYDSGKTRTTLDERGLRGRIAHKGEKAPDQATGRRHVERTHARQNAFHRLARCHERRIDVVDAFFDLTYAVSTVRSLIRRARSTHRWVDRPTGRPWPHTHLHDSAWQPSAAMGYNIAANASRWSRAHCSNVPADRPSTCGTWSVT